MIQSRTPNVLSVGVIAREAITVDYVTSLLKYSHKKNLTQIRIYYNTLMT